LQRLETEQASLRDLRCTTACQEEACGRIEALRARAQQLKRDAIQLADEDSANAALSLEHRAEAALNELSMMITLKRGTSEGAFDLLVKAQEAARTAMQAHSVSSDLNACVERLALIEKQRFPPKVFLSPGMLVGRMECSICGGEYGECAHVVGRAYMGKMCCRVLKDITIREVSIVATPANKQCRPVLLK
jgi:hypothetical protein